MKKELLISCIITVMFIGIVLITNNNPSINLVKTLNTPTVSTITDYKTSAITALEVKKHKNATDCWIIIRGNVYDVTSYLSRHPGGNEEVIKTCGTDATNLYDAIKEGRGHSKAADIDLSSLLVGAIQ